MTKWTKEYDNDTGPYDDYFKEWWNVTDGNRTYRCNNSDDADFLIAALAQPEQEPVAWAVYEADGTHHNKPCQYPKCSYPCPDLPDCRDAQPEQEPVAIALNTGTKQGVKWLKNVEHGESLYTTPPQRTWVGLTYKEVQEIHDTYHKRMGPQEFASMIEAKLKEKNT